MIVSFPLKQTREEAALCMPQKIEIKLQKKQKDKHHKGGPRPNGLLWRRFYKLRSSI